MGVGATAMLGFALRNAPDSATIPVLYLAGGVAVVCMLMSAGPAGGLYQQACGNSQGFLGAIYTVAFAMGRPVGALLGGALLDTSPWPLIVTLVVGSVLTVV